MRIEQCTTEQQFEEMMAMAKNHPEPEYDCDFETFYKVCKKMFNDPAFKAWIVYADGSPCGYISGYRNKTLNNEINVFDIFLEEVFWGKIGITLLTDKIKEWAVSDKALRVTWTSKVSARAWTRITGLDVSEVKTLVWEVG